ncbi:MAG: DEAD/DEAH box helicase [Candidatus Paceibacterota bacterium]|jgi:superfamily II DNA/RNA helicase
MNTHYTKSKPAHAGSNRARSFGSSSEASFSSAGTSPRGHAGRRNFGRGRGRSAQKGQRIDESRFINKASVTNATSEYVPQYTFADFEIDGRLKQNIARKGFTKPTSIQDKTIPPILKGKDVIGLADTGTGKTAAFLIPLINKVLKDKTQKVLILAPTRELALQINVECMEFAKGLGVYSVVAVGGESIREQIFQIRRGFNLLIGTPGRLRDLVDRKVIHLDVFQNAVLDEADRMLDMGFLPDVKFLLGQLRKDRQTVFFSATVPQAINDLTKTFSDHPIKIETKLRDTSSDVEQDIIRVSLSENKVDVLSALLKKKEFKKVLIFGKTKIGVQHLADDLERRGFVAMAIHGDKYQANREKTLRSFKQGRIAILVATDVAARGLDVPDVTHVINYDLPSTYDDYIHRIGRTGRAGKKGLALTFIGGREPHRVAPAHTVPSKNFRGGSGSSRRPFVSRGQGRDRRR